MSKLYYVGEVGTNDKVSSIKFDKILDYVDTDLVFNEKGKFLLDINDKFYHQK